MVSCIPVQPVGFHSFQNTPVTMTLSKRSRYLRSSFAVNCFRFSCIFVAEAPVFLRPGGFAPLRWHAAFSKFQEGQLSPYNREQRGWSPLKLRFLYSNARVSLLGWPRAFQ